MSMISLLFALFPDASSVVVPLNCECKSINYFLNDQIFFKKFLSPDIHCIVQQTPSLKPPLSNLTLKSLLRFPLSRYLELGLQKYNLILNCQMFFNKILNPLPAAPLSYYLHPDLSSTSLPGLSIWDCKDTQISTRSKLNVIKIS